MALQFLINGIIAGSLIAIMAMGFSLIYSTTRIFHIAHGVVYTAGAYAFYTFANILNLPFLLSLIISLIIVIMLGVLIEWVIYAPLNKKNASTGVVFISSFAVYILVVNLIALAYGNETKVLSSNVEPSISMGNVILTKIQIIQILVFLAVLLIGSIFLKNTKTGKIFRAMGDNPLLLTVLGINMQKTRILIFALGSGLAGVASIVTALDLGIDPHVGMTAILNAAVAVIIGGVEKFEGAVIGAFVIGLLQNILIWQFSARWEAAVTFLLLIIFLMYKPEGILGVRKRVEET